MKAYFFNENPSEIVLVVKNNHSDLIVMCISKELCIISMLHERWEKVTIILWNHRNICIESRENHKSRAS